MVLRIRVQEFVEHGVELLGQEIKGHLMVLSCTPLSVCLYSLYVCASFHSVKCIRSYFLLILLSF